MKKEDQRQAVLLGVALRAGASNVGPMVGTAFCSRMYVIYCASSLATVGAGIVTDDVIPPVEGRLISVAELVKRFLTG